jgi:outer membrane biogenesis lipoprotein LolB
MKAATHLFGLMVVGLLTACTPDSAARFQLDRNQMHQNTDQRFAARQDYERAVAEYQACLVQNSEKPDACEDAKNVMDTDAQVLSSVGRATER